MIDLGTVRPGSTIRIPFSSFDKDDGSSITMTNYAAADILVYKDGGTTERASTAGFTATTDFDSKTGKHLAVIDLADNTTASFWNAGSEYLVAIDAVTVDAVTTGAWIARFRIGYPSAVLDTTIATLASQTSFTLTVGPAEDDALNGMWAVIHDIASAVQFAKVLILDYTGSTKTVTLAAGATFTAAAGDNFSVIDMAPLQPATTGRTLVVDSAGLADANMVKVGPTGSGTAQTARDIGASVLLSSGTGTGQVKLASGYVAMTWADIGAPTTVVNLSGTTVKTATDVVTEIINVLNDTDSIISELAKVPKSDSNVSWNATAAAQIQSEANDAIVANNLDHLVLSAVDTDFATTVHLNSVIGHLADNGTSATFDRTTDSLEAARDNVGTAGAGLTAADDAVITAIGALNNITAASVWAVGTRTLTAGTNIDGSTFTAIPWNAAWDAEVQSEVADALAVYDPPTHTELTAAFTEIKGATWASTDSLEAIRDRGDAAWLTATGFSTLTAADVRTAVGLASANLDTQLADIPTVAEFEARTITAATYATAANLATVAGYLDTEIAAILEDTGTTLPAQIAALNNLSAAQVTAAVPTAAQNAAAILAAGDVDGYTLEQTLKLCLAVLAGKLSGAATTTVAIRAADDSKARVTATVDASGNRSAVTLDAAG